jgi:putative transposase
MSEPTSGLEIAAEVLAGVESKQPINQELDILNGSQSLPYALQRRLVLLQRLKSYEGKAEYGHERIKVCQELGISMRSLFRYIRKYRKEGIEGIVRRERSDQGEARVSEAWQEFIEKKYQEGNRGMRSTSVSQIVNMVASRAQELGETKYPSRATIYRVLEAEIARRSQKEKARAIGWQGDRLQIITREGIELDVKYSNQVWQCDHTPADILVLDREGEILGRPCLTTVIDTYSRCIVGIHLGMEAPSAAVTCLALRHAIAPKQYGSAYELSNLWGTYGIPQYLYTDAGPDFTSHHIDQIAASLGITLCLRRRPSDGGIVERPFGTLNSEFFSTLPGYTTNQLKGHRTKVEAEACLRLEDLERLLVRYIVDRYNQQPDPRVGKESRIGRWEAGRIVQPPLIGERELDVLLMRQDRRSVYQGGYIRFANLVYRGEYLAGYAGQSVVLRYDPRDISSLLVYRQEGSKDVFLTRAHAQHLDAERLSLAEAKAIKQRLRTASKEITNQSVLKEIGERSRYVEQLLQESSPSVWQRSSSQALPPEPIETEIEDDEPIFPRKMLDVQVYDYEQLRREKGR